MSVDVAKGSARLGSYPKSGNLTSNKKSSVGYFELKLHIYALGHQRLILRDSVIAAMFTSVEKDTADQNKNRKLWLTGA